MRSLTMKVSKISLVSSAWHIAGASSTADAHSSPKIYIWDPQPLVPVFSAHANSVLVAVYARYFRKIRFFSVQNAAIICVQVSISTSSTRTVWLPVACSKRLLRSSMRISIFFQIVVGKALEFNNAVPDWDRGRGPLETGQRLEDLMYDGREEDGFIESQSVPLQRDDLVRNISLALTLDRIL